MNNKKKNRSNFKFSMIGAKVGETVVFTPTKTEVVIASDDEVEHEGIRYRLSTFAANYAPIKRASYRGPDYFTYKGRTLTELRDELEGYAHSKKSHAEKDVNESELSFAPTSPVQHWWLVANPKMCIIRVGWMVSCFTP